MQHTRRYGEPPYNTALIHGGPGAAGEMAPVAVELSKTRGILEPIQAEKSVEGQIKELAAFLEKTAVLPAVLAGYSWGAWLSAMLAARHPGLVKKLVLISSGPFEEKYAAGIQATRMKRLKPAETDEINFLLDALDNPAARNKDRIFARIGELMSKADSFKPLEQDGAKITLNSSIYSRVWKEAEAMRRDGSLLKLMEAITCPVIAIHGDYDSHPADGVREPLSKAVKDFKFILLKKCGHTPWMEKEAKAEFYSALNRELLPPENPKGTQDKLF
jgi:pimeloyl-ACP methyl ester carboxylesterase